MPAPKGRGIPACTEAEPTCVQNSWHMLLKILPCPKLHLQVVRILSGFLSKSPIHIVLSFHSRFTTLFTTTSQSENPKPPTSVLPFTHHNLTSAQCADIMWINLKSFWHKILNWLIYKYHYSKRMSILKVIIAILMPNSSSATGILWWWEVISFWRSPCHSYS